ncbi:hypothetical protein K502DRAFT_297364 [Neoconidiobolus thromboides FSU 785]|nr:hypothetical protein K502DRAFT_297364 [Neoconidiobolus thromboides FSU 785]
MRAALDADNNDFKAGVPALNKLSCLPKVVQIMKKTYNHNSLLEIGILEEVRNFLEPYPDGSLPILNIQIELISLLEQMPITTDFLRNSYLGRIVKFYSICPRITKEVQKQAKSLVSKWTQNIIRQSGSYQKFRMQMRNANQHDRVPENNNKKQMSNKQANLMKTMSKLKRDNRSRR